MGARVSLEPDAFRSPADNLTLIACGANLPFKPSGPWWKSPSLVFVKKRFRLTSCWDVRTYN
uniref:Uncharacterized protein n=1 Tax=Anguilla anguilla TaxID=7936 RepID=A0A0E9S2E8_ANGAN